MKHNHANNYVPSMGTTRAHAVAVGAGNVFLVPLLRVVIVFLVSFVLLSGAEASAATLRMSPETGVYSAGNTFTASVLVNTQGKPINAADASLTFNPKELSVVSVSKGNSIFGLWTQEPTFSNSAGTISFGGGSPSGYTGAAGTIMTVTFKAMGAGTPKVTFKGGSILAADGLGTNVLTAMNGGTYTIGAQSSTPEPEYITPANTPKAPSVTSTSHPDEKLWYKESVATLLWDVPSDVTAIRLLVNDSPLTIPNVVYEDRISKKVLEDLSEGVSYFHIQFKNKDGWGKVTHFKLNVDSKEPSTFAITEKDTDTANPARTLLFAIEDVSPITQYSIQIDGAEPLIHKDESGSKSYTLPILPPGHHTVVVEAFDSAGHSKVSSYAFDIVSFEAPVFTEYPDRVNTDVVPAFFGTTRPLAEVAISVKAQSGDTKTYTAFAHDDGSFMFVPDEAFSVGVYDISAVAKEKSGALSETSNTIRIIAEVPGYIRFGSFMISILSVVVPLFALVICLLFGVWYLWHTLARWKRKVALEAKEIDTSLHSEFQEILTHMHANVAALKESRKGKLTKAETVLVEQIETDLERAHAHVQKEIVDVEKIVS